MIKLKKAFSLAELLIALAIISILTVMFISISKSGLENAYKLYYYTGYKALSDAISYSNEKSGDTTRLYYKYIADAFGYPNQLEPPYGPMPTIKTKNGISYDISPLGATGDNITMTIPSENGDITVTLTYYNNVNSGIIIPNNVTKPDGTTFKLYDRKDLLPFYIDDGTKGRSLQYYDSNSSEYKTANTSEWNWSTNKRDYYSFKNAYCMLANKDPWVTGIIGACSSTKNLNGFLKVADPKKVL